MTPAPARVSAVMEPARAFTTNTTLRDLVGTLRGGAPGFFYQEGHWRAVLAPMLVGLPPTRRLIDLPAVIAPEVHPDDHLLTGLSVLDTVSLSAIPVVDGDTMVGRLDRNRLLQVLNEELHDDLVLELTTLRSATLAVAHDMANALHVARLQAELGESLDAVHAIDQVTILLHRIRDVQLGARPQQGRVDVAEAVERLLPILETLGRAHTSVIYERRGGRYLARCHPLLIDRALINLVANARDAAKPKHTKTRIGVREEGDMVVLRVTDDGPGIAPEVITSIFDRGFSTKGGHAGIGLSALRRNARDAGGDLTVSSVHGEGASFELRLPRIDPSPDQGATGLHSR